MNKLKAGLSLTTSHFCLLEIMRFGARTFKIGDGAGDTEARPMSGDLLVFRWRQCPIKVMRHDGQGNLQFTKRLELGYLPEGMDVSNAPWRASSRERYTLRRIRSRDED